ncbi:MAG: nitroreductase family protein [Saprospiraceae bacterium]
MKNKLVSIPYLSEQFSEEQMLTKAKYFFTDMNKRRSVREFSSKPVSLELIQQLVLTAGTAPSGANKQPWTFCIVTNPEIKTQIKIAAEQEEFKAYNGGMPEEWLEDLSYLGTDWHKDFLEIAPVLIVVFRKPYDLVDGFKKKNYYVQESVGLACGLLLSAIHQAGLVALTHTPSPMNFLQEILARPENEKPFLLIPIGFPAENCTVPDISRKTFQEVSVIYS